MRLIFGNQNKNSTWSLKTEAGIKFVNVSTPNMFCVQFLSPVTPTTPGGGENRPVHSGLQ